VPPSVCPHAIEVEELKTYASLGMHDHIGFLIGSETIDQTELIAPMVSLPLRG
jgi:hypothetical protein